MKQLTHAQKEKRREYSRKWWAENKSVSALAKKAAKKQPAKKVQSIAPVESNSDLISIINAYKTLHSAAKG